MTEYCLETPIVWSLVSIKDFNDAPNKGVNDGSALGINEGCRDGFNDGFCDN